MTLSMLVLGVLALEFGLVVFIGKCIRAGEGPLAMDEFDDESLGIAADRRVEGIHLTNSLAAMAQKLAVTPREAEAETDQPQFSTVGIAPERTLKIPIRKNRLIVR